MAKNPFPLDEVLRMQKEFAELKMSTGLVALNLGYVQVRPETLAELADPSTWQTERVEYMDGSTGFHVNVKIKGMKFLAVLYVEEFAEYGLEVPG